jgi:hypothetical protein
VFVLTTVLVLSTVVVNAAVVARPLMPLRLPVSKDLLSMNGAGEYEMAQNKGCIEGDFV